MVKPQLGLYRQSGHPRRALYLVLLVVCVLAASSCSLYGPAPGPTVLTQHDGRPSLHRLNWGYAYVDSGYWSPDGRWIAILAGVDFSASQVVVLSPDGSTHQDLASWHCGASGEFDFMWAPDGRLGCMVADDLVPGTKRLCAGGPPTFRSCHNLALPWEVGRSGSGSAWSADGATVWITAIQDYAGGDVSHNPDLFVVNATTGALVQTMPFSNEGGIYLPVWVPGQSPQQQVLSYEVGSADIWGPGQLVMSTVTRDASGHYALGPRTVLASGQVQDGYAWSPSGHWVAVRVGGDQGNDHIALVNAADPAQTVDVTNEADVGNMLNPIWSPDGQTLIVISAANDQPYAIDIGRYLASKGLQP